MKYIKWSPLLRFPPAAAHPPHTPHPTSIFSNTPLFHTGERSDFLSLSGDPLGFIFHLYFLSNRLRSRSLKPENIKRKNKAPSLLHLPLWSMKIEAKSFKSKWAIQTARLPVKLLSDFLHRTNWSFQKCYPPTAFIHLSKTFAWWGIVKLTSHKDF